MPENVGYPDSKVKRLLSAGPAHGVGKSVSLMSMNKLKKIGRRVAGLRKDKDLTQIEAAIAIGIARSTLGEIEIGSEQGGIDSMIAIADYFKVPMDWLLCRTVPPGGPLVGKFVDEPDVLAWINFWENLSDIDRNAAIKLLRIPGISVA